jgi:hypothetical protein
LSFGDFAMDPILEEGGMQIFIFWFAVIIMCLIMLNLLIGILSEAMADVLATAEQSDMAALNGIVYDLESLMFWVGQDKNDESKNAEHLIFAVAVEEIEEEKKVDETALRMDTMAASLKKTQADVANIVKQNNDVLVSNKKIHALLKKIEMKE